MPKQRILSLIVTHHWPSVVRKPDVSDKGLPFDNDIVFLSHLILVLLQHIIPVLKYKNA